MVELNPELLVPDRHEQRPVHHQVKADCLKLAGKYLSKEAEAFYASLTCEEDFVENED